jgi:hypothetical protein
VTGRWLAAPADQGMPSKATISVGEKFLYDFKAGLADGRLRRPSSAGNDPAARVIFVLLATPRYRSLPVFL